MTSAPALSVSVPEFVWPAEPYPGLDYFRAEDRPLLAGREHDVQWFSDLLSHPSARVVLLHGMTGAGKSSFLRAGLIPALAETGGYYFLRQAGEAINEALFVRCTATPVDQMAAQIYRFATSPLTIPTPRGLRSVELGDALLGCDDLTAYLKAARDDGGLVESLRRISARLPQTLVLVVDQAEEIFTLNQEEETAGNRSAFFHVLRELQSSRLDLRVIVTLRTEFHGRLFDAISFGGSAGDGLKSYHLADLGRDALIEAIRRPTRTDDIGGFGAPFDAYRFEFDPGLPERIADDIVARRFQGATGPVVQLVCRGLYEGLIQQSTRCITLSQYEAKLGVEGQIIGHLEKAAARLAAAIRPFGGLDNAQSRLRQALELLLQREPDGTVVARTRDRNWYEASLARVFSDLSAADRARFFEHAASKELLILRETRETDGLGRESVGVTLAHDCIAFGVTKWRTPDLRLNDQKAAIKRVNERMFFVLLGVGIAGALVAQEVGLIDDTSDIVSGDIAIIDTWYFAFGVFAVFALVNSDFVSGFVNMVSGVIPVRYRQRVKAAAERHGLRHHKVLFRLYARLGLIRDPSLLEE